MKNEIKIIKNDDMDFLFINENENVIPPNAMITVSTNVKLFFN